MDKIVKQQILQEINELEVNDLLEMIGANEISLEEMVDAGLERAKVNEILNLQNEVKPDPISDSDLLEEIKSICQSIENDEYDIMDIRRFLLNNVITPDQLKQYTSMTDDIIEKIKYYERNDLIIDRLEDEPPFLPDRTDVYFLGQPGSGKSCVLGSLFHYFHTQGLMVEDIGNPTGTLYRNHLRHEFSYGILPNSNAVDDLYPMPFQLRNLSDSSKRHPLNFIDMSGEVFDDIYEGGMTAIKPKFEKYLKNKNRKILFFIIDFDLHKRSRRVSLGMDQGSKALKVLETLDQFGTLKKVDAIYLLVTKSDLFPKEVNKKDYTKDFIDQYFRSLLNTLEDKKKEYENSNKFSVTIYPFSIGEVKYKGLLVNPDSSGVEYVTKAIQKHAFIGKKSGAFGKIFGN